MFQKVRKVSHKSIATASVNAKRRHEYSVREDEEPKTEKVEPPAP
jgi:hypothetical protein